MMPGGGKANSGFLKEAWLVMAYGGWWITDDVNKQVDHPLAFSQLSRAFWHMYNCGYVRKRARFDRRMEYAVDFECSIPVGVTIREFEHARSVNEALRMPQPAAFSERANGAGRVAFRPGYRISHPNYEDGFVQDAIGLFVR
jgi:hypothetical protein